MRAAHAFLCLLAGLSLCLSALPRLALLPALAGLCVHAVRQWREQANRAPMRLQVADDGAWVAMRSATGSGVLLADCRIEVRAALAQVRGVDPDGVVRTWQFWPDTLDEAALRRLRLAARGPGAQSSAAIATMPG